jgi:probable rRNA maturation factor
MEEEGPSPLTVRVDEPAWHGPIEDIEKRCREAVTAALDETDGPPWLATAEIDILLSGDAEVGRLNATWRGRDAPTDVLSFPEFDLDPAALPAAPPAPFAARLGDIVLAYHTVERDARAEGKALAHHLAHLIVHGTLHLLGHDHAEDTDAARMEALERAALARLGIADPYRELEVVG